MTFIVMLEDSSGGVVWLADGDGDPPRKLRMENAKRFDGRRSALKALAHARTYRPFRRAQLVDADNQIIVFDR